MADDRPESQTPMQRYLKEAIGDEFWAIRGRALDAYAILEHSLSDLLATLIRTPHTIASAIFFKITNADAVHKIIVKLVTKLYGSTYTTLIKSFKKLLGQTAIQRNNIVHWTAVMLQKPGGEYSRTVLRPGHDVWAEQETVDKEAMLEFIAKCQYLTGVCNQFADLLRMNDGRRNEVLEGELRESTEHCQKELTWPPNPSNPLNPSWLAEGAKHIPTRVATDIADNPTPHHDQ
jgi:hypothetical protein